MGCALVSPAGQSLGIVEGWDETGGPVLLRVKPAAGREEILVPFARSICTDIDVAAKRIVANLPEGLIELP